MSGAIFARSASVATPDVPLALDDRSFRLLSADRTLSMDLNADPFRMLVGAVGLEAPDVDVALEELPNAPGGVAQDVRVPSRTIALPMRARAGTPAEVRAAKGRLRALLGIGHLVGGVSGWLVCQSASGTREIGVVYRGGLGGVEVGAVAYDRFGLELRCPDPYAYGEPRAESFHLAPSALLAMTSADPAAAATAGVVRGLASSTVLGQDMPVTVVSDAPTYPTIDVTGPFTAPVHVTSSAGLDVTIPGGLAAGAVLRIVTAPRGKSIRLDGVPAAGLVSRGSRLAPLPPGRSTLSVSAAGATAQSRVDVSWRGAYLSLWG